MSETDNHGVEDLNRTDANMAASNCVDVLAERVKFDLIGKTESGHELRVWTDGERVVWEDDEGRSGYMPAMLFRLAAHQLAHYCEDVARGDDGEQQDNFDTALHDSLSCPIDLAMAHPYWAQPDHESNQLKFGFSSIASNMAMDVQPNGLRPRDSFGDGDRTDPEWGQNQTINPPNSTPSESQLLAVDSDARLLFGQLCSVSSSHPGSGPKLATIRRFLAMRDANGVISPAQVFLESILGSPQGRIVSSADLTPHQVAEAQASERWFVTSGGLGFAVLPWELTTDKDVAREHGWDNIDKALPRKYTQGHNQ